MIFVKHGDRVEAEAAALAAIRHPGVVELVDVVDGALRTSRVEGRSLDAMPPLAPDEVAGVAAAVATTLADLHDLGAVHGGVEASHVLVGTDGRIVLCSLGRPGDPAEDVAALGRLVTGLLADAAPTAPGRAGHGTGRRRRPVPGRAGVGRRGRPARLGSLLAPPAAPGLTALAAEAVHPEPGRRPTARRLAEAVHQRIPTARLPVVPPGGPTLPIGPTPRPSRAPMAGRPASPLPGPTSRTSRAAMAGGAVRGVLLAGVALVLPPLVLGALVLGGLVLVESSNRGSGAPPPTGAPSGGTGQGGPEAGPSGTAGSAPVAERVWPEPPIEFAGGVLTVGGTRYAVGAPGDVVVAGDWTCTGVRNLALLRVASGEVFAFDGWARAGADVAARPIGVVEGAAGLRVADPDRDGCDDLEVERPGRPALRIPVPPPDGVGPAGGKRP